MRKSVGILFDSLLLITFLTLLYHIVLQRSNPSNEATKVSFIRRVSDFNHLSVSDANLLDERITYISDQRTSSCRGEWYRLQSNSVTIIIDFYDYQFFSLKVTIASILEHTERGVISEIIIIDDGSTLSHIADELSVLISVISYTKLIRSEFRKGQGHSRNIAIQSATSKNVVFIDTNTIVSEGWLPPLIQQLEKHPEALIQPSYDSIHDSVTYEYVRATHSSLVTFDWKGNLHVVDVNDTSAQFTSPVVRGNVLVMKLDSYNRFGGYDEEYKSGGGEHLEMSIRAWFTCRDIIVASCSRVALINRNSAVVTQSSTNKKRTIALWMDSTNKNIMLGVAGISDEVIPEILHSIQERRVAVLKNKQCKQQKRERTFTDYIDSISSDLLYKMSMLPTEYGYLQVASGKCAYITDTDRLQLHPCPERWLPIQQQMLFTFAYSRIKFKGKCLEASSMMYVKVKDCNSSDDNQKWTFQSNRFVNKGRDLCLTHVTDPDKKLKQTQILMAQSCDADSKEDKRFSTFEFINS